MNDNKKKRMFKGKRSFTIQEDQFLKDNIEKLNNNELAEQLGRSMRSVTCRLVKLGLKRSEEARARISITRFKKGQIPWNRGLKGIHMSPETEFKKGTTIPPQTKWDGYISLRNVNNGTYNFYIRIAKAKWMPLQQFYWEKKFGKLPKGYFLRCKTDDTLNCSSENWIMVDRAENIRLNHNAEKTSRAMKRLWEQDHHLKSDNFIAFTLAAFDEDLREEVLKHTELIELKRKQLKLKRAVKRQLGE